MCFALFSGAFCQYNDFHPFFQVTFQKEGQYIVTPVGIFHWGINICSNVHEAWNVTSMKWSGMMQIIDRSYCICGEVKDPARLRFSGEIVDGVYRAAIVSGKC